MLREKDGMYIEVRDRHTRTESQEHLYHTLNINSLCPIPSAFHSDTCTHPIPALSESILILSALWRHVGWRDKCLCLVLQGLSLWAQGHTHRKWAIATASRISAKAHGRWAWEKEHWWSRLMTPTHTWTANKLIHLTPTQTPFNLNNILWDPRPPPPQHHPASVSTKGTLKRRETLQGILPSQPSPDPFPFISSCTN